MHINSYIQAYTHIQVHINKYQQPPLANGWRALRALLLSAMRTLTHAHLNKNILL